MESKSVKFREFNPKTDNWDSYIDRLNYCFIANGIKEDVSKKANFFTVCGEQVFETLLALITPKKSSDVTYSEVINILTNHFSPKPNEISMSYKFYRLDQNKGESAADYIAQLRKISSCCNFVDLERMLRDRLVCGMLDTSLQYELLKKCSLTYQNVVDAMMSSESAGKDVRMMHSAVSTSSTYEEATTSVCYDPTQARQLAPEPMDINAVQSSSNVRLCYRCGDRHSGECRFVNAVCRYCKKKGHLEKICIAKKKNKNIHYTEEEYDSLNGIYSLDTQNNTRVPPYSVEVLLDSERVVMQVDSGASYSIVNERTWRAVSDHRAAPALRRAPLALRTWTDSPVQLLGQTTLHVQYKDITCELCVIVAKGRGPYLLGRDWFEPLGITMNIHYVTDTDIIITDNIIDKHREVFKEGLGTYRGQPVAIHLKPEVTPKFLKARLVPYAIKERVEKEIDRLVEEDVLRPVSFSEWATPVVPIVKKTGEIRLCGDYRSTVNQATESDTYPMPTASEVFATVTGAKYYTKLDLERAYTQVVVDDNTAKLLTLNTCKGLYTVHRLAFGVKACPGIFQRLMTSLLAGIPGVAVLIDDIIISGHTMPEMLQRLDEVLQRIGTAGLRLNKSKCKFSTHRVEFLGFIIDADGIHPSPSKVESINRTPEPKNIRELQAFLGLYNFYERFIRHKATVLEPLHRLLDKTQEWYWGEQEQVAFETAKRLITCDMTLVHYDLKKPLVLTCDSSEYGVGAVLAHIMEDGQEHPIAMGSRTLHSHERKYSQLDKEAASIMFGISKFHNYLMGRFFTVITDHKPLLGIFDTKKPIPNILSPRLTRIAIALTSHDYEIRYRPGKQIGNADSLSRWPQPVPEQPEPYIGDILLMAETPDEFPYDAVRIADETKKDKILSTALHYIQCGWPTKVRDDELHAYWLHRTELSVHEGCILLGCRVVVPPALRANILNTLHRAHSGIVQTKALARSYVWWPHLGEDIEVLVKNCQKCLEHRHMPPKTSHEWITPTRPWSRLHIDFAGPFHNRNFLIMVDAYSRWPEVFMVNNITSQTVIHHLRNVFAIHGLCETLVSDNGTSFVSNETKQFLLANKIKHVTAAPYHPATNGLAERMVQTVKDKLRKMESLPWEQRLPNMLLGLRVTPCATTSKTPAELLMHRKLRTLLDAIHPDNMQHDKIEQQIEDNAQKKNRESNIDENVMYRNYGKGPKWLPGRVIDKEGPSSYSVQSEDGVIVNRHIDQLVKTGGPKVNTGERRTEVVSEGVAVEESNECGRNRQKDYDEIIEIPSADQWAEMLGIPSTSKISLPESRKIKNKINHQDKCPYARPNNETNYLC